MIELILWRHADAEDGWPDLKRQLTATGHAQAQAMAGWLRARLPARFAVICSPADRARQTASALTRDYRIEEQLMPGADIDDYARLIEWPHGPQGCPGLLVVVAHQPVLGALAARLMTGIDLRWELEKSGIWWFSAREAQARGETILKAMITPAMLEVAAGSG